MKKFIVLFFSLFLIFLTGCNDEKTPTPTPKETFEIEGTPFRLSSIVDETLDNGVRSYAVIAPYTDTYTIRCTKTSRIVIYDESDIIKEGVDNFEVDLVKDTTYGIRVETNGEKISFKLHVEAKNNKITLPYDVAQPIDITSYSTSSNGTDPLTDATVNYTKRSGGKYIYSNNPELIPADSVGKAFISNTGLEGDVFFTFEHANYSGRPIYLGYQLKNEGTTDVLITVTNIGYQAGGTWFGQFAWFDYYNTSFSLPEEYLSNMDKYSNYDYAYQTYTPRIFQPTTYRLPAGQYFYVIGGTTADAYKNINVDDSANKLLDVNKCANGNVKFSVTGGTVTGTFYAYEEISQVLTPQTQQGYRIGNYAAQYSGIADHAGVIDNYSTWVFSDETKSCNLPVEFSSVYADNVPAKTTAYAEYANEVHQTIGATSWITHLNPQNDHRAVGMDIVEFDWVDTFGDPIRIDNLHADGSGAPANTANWMIEYQEHYTFVNQGDNARSITLGLKDGGTLAIMLRNSQTGEVLSTYYTMGQANLNYNFKIYIPAHSVTQITLQYILVACSYGNVTHWITLT